MAEMNAFLADLYGTVENIGLGADREKLAQAQMLDEMFAAEGINVDALEPAVIEKVANQIFGEKNLLKVAEGEEAAHEGGETPAEEKKEEEAKAEEKKEEEEKEAQAKLAEADFLGRVMAHSFVDEQAAIEKAAAKLPKIPGPTILQRIQHLGSKLTPGALEKKVIESAKARGYEASRVKAMGGAAGPLAPGSGAHRAAERRGVQEAAGALRRLHTGVGAAVPAAGVLAAGGTAAALAGGKKKKASALDVLAEQRVMQYLEANGIKLASEQTEEEKLAEAVDRRAIEMLAEMGIQVE